MALGGLVGLFAYRVATREQRRARERSRALRRSWRHPERIASGKEGPFLEELGRRILLGVLGYAGVALGKRAVHRYIAP